MTRPTLQLLHFEDRGPNLPWRERSAGVLQMGHGSQGECVRRFEWGSAHATDHGKHVVLYDLDMRWMVGLKSPHRAFSPLEILIASVAYRAGARGDDHG